MSLKLRDGNPNVVDLSDEYRPTKLVEISSELYDNEWTEAYEFLLKVKPGLGDGADRQHVRFLLDVLLVSALFFVFLYLFIFFSQETLRIFHSIRMTVYLYL